MSFAGRESRAFYNIFEGASFCLVLTNIVFQLVDPVVVVVVIDVVVVVVVVVIDVVVIFRGEF